MANEKLNKDALRYHVEGRPGKIEVVPTKPYSTQRDLSLAYSPGVAIPCLEIEKNIEDAYKYTNKGNLVGVISNGTAVLGLGDIGTLAGKPVMEGKGLLFKIFSGIDVFDIELDTKDIDKFVETVKTLSPTLGGINLEDIKAPECFEIEKRLVEELDIPVMHDDQHGTAIISSAALLNALDLSNKKIEKVKIVVNGAGASAMACSKLMLSLGAKSENVIMLDSKGVLRKDRTDLNKYKQEFATDKDLTTLEEAIKGADVFLGLSKGNIVNKDMIRSMAPNCIVFAMANPDPEISYPDAMDARDDIIMATGRSDFPNQVNNVLGFPFIFRGAMDVRSTKINEEMKKAAVYALAELAREIVPENVAKAYNVTNLTYGKEYIIPKPFDPRLILKVAPAVAKAAIKTGVALKPITDWDKYDNKLTSLMGLENQIIRGLHTKARKKLMKVVFAEGENFAVLKAAQEAKVEGYLNPVLIGNEEEIKKIAKEYTIDLEGIEIIDHLASKNKDLRLKYAEKLWEKRQRKGLSKKGAKDKVKYHNYFASMMLETGDVDAMVSGYETRYNKVAATALKAIGAREDVKSIMGMYIVISKNKAYFFGDTTVNTTPEPDVLACNAKLIAEEIKKFGIEPVIAMLSYSNFGSVNDRISNRVREAVKILHESMPDLIVDGDIQANIAVNKEDRDSLFPFSKLNGKDVNVLIFPTLSSGNIGYKLMQTLGRAEIIGPIVLGMNKPVHIVPINCSVKEIIDIAVIAAVDAQSKE
ncbi:MAG: NADP-dependent malic enzyme [Bacteroidota bacterium]|nr:NADP-dependent malic enzyme [Bacteroidota bacterium]